MLSALESLLTGGSQEETPSAAEPRYQPLVVVAHRPGKRNRGQPLRVAGDWRLRGFFVLADRGRCTGDLVVAVAQGAA